MAGDDVVLSRQEQEVLANLAASVDDPWLAEQLAGPGAAPPSSRQGWLGPWAGMVFLFLGVVLATATFARWLWAGALGLTLITLGGWLLWREQVVGQRATAWKQAEPDGTLT